MNKLITELGLEGAELSGAQKLVEHMKTHEDTAHMGGLEMDGDMAMAMNSQIGEFLSAFVVFGYDIEGNRVSTWSVPNKMCLDAVVSQFPHVHELMMETIEGVYYEELGEDEAGEF